MICNPLRAIPAEITTTTTTTRLAPVDHVEGQAVCVTSGPDVWPPPGAAEAADLVGVAVPLKAYLRVPAEPLAGKTVIDAIGYDAVDAGQLAEGRRLQPDTPPYGTIYAGGDANFAASPGVPAGADGIRRLLAAAGG